jgi:hypothetical protein
VGTIVPSERKTPYYVRWQAGIQRDLGAGWLVEAYYLGSRGRNLPVLRELNGIPLQYLSTSPTRDTANESYLSGQVPNPFQGLLPGTSLNGSTIARGQLLRPFPQFLAGAANGSITGTVSVGTEEYVGGQLRRAPPHREAVLGRPRCSPPTRAPGSDSWLPEPSTPCSRTVSPQDRPNRVTAGATFRSLRARPEVGQREGRQGRASRMAAQGTYEYQTASHWCGTPAFITIHRDRRTSAQHRRAHLRRIAGPTSCLGHWASTSPGYGPHRSGS